jgi:hypothetical protein
LSDAVRDSHLMVEAEVDAPTTGRAVERQPIVSVVTTKQE